MAIYDFDNIVRTKDITHYVTGGNGSMGGLYNAFNQYANTDYILFTKNTNYPNYLPITYSDGIVSSEYCPDSSYGYIVLPFQSLQNLFKIEFDLKVDAQYSANSYGIFLVRADTNGSSNRITLYEAYPAPQMSDFQHFEIDISNQDVEYGYIAITYSYSNKSTIKNIKFYTIDVSPSGGAGSGYIGNSLLSNKKMVGYNVPTSSAESTKTESIEDASASPVSGKPKIGNGYARIKIIAQEKEYNIDELLKNKNFSDSSQYSIVYAEGYSGGIGNRIPNFVGTNTILGSSTGQASNFTLPTYSNNAFNLTAMLNLGYGYMCMPIIPMYVSKVSFEYKITGSGYNQEDFKALLCSDDGTSISHYDIRVAPPLTSTDWTLMEYTLSSSEFAKLYTYFALQRNSIQIQVRNIKITGVLKPAN